MVNSEINREALFAELEFHKTEFTVLRSEILQRVDSEKQFLNLSLVAIAAALGFAPFILQQGLFIAFLLYPFVFHVLLWEMLSAVRMIGRLASYLAENVIPRVNSILDILGDDRQGVTVLGWEMQWKRRELSKSDWIFISLSPTRHWVPILAIAALLIAYIVITNDYGYTPSIGEFFLIIINLVFLILAALLNFGVARTAVLETQRLQKQAEQLTVKTDEQGQPPIKEGSSSIGSEK